jgi:glycosyltransferase involved in cell wall biosynthesis
MRTQLHQRVPESLKSRVQWLGFVPDAREIFSIYRNCHALVLPSQREPWGLVINEAAASGLPIVASAGVGAVPELVKEDVNGITFPTGDLDGLIHALRNITFPGTAERLGARSREVLATMRASADPVKAMRQALHRSGVMR